MALLYYINFVMLVCITDDVSSVQDINKFLLCSVLLNYLYVEKLVYLIIQSLVRQSGIVVFNLEQFNIFVVW